MPAPFVQIKYDVVDAIIVRFQKLHDQSQTIQASVCQTINSLQAGQWQGSAANACFQEFEHVVNPAFQRLLHALQGSVETTKAIRQIMADAETEAAALFRDDFGPITLGGNRVMFEQETGGATPTPTPPEPPLKLPFLQKFIDFMLKATEIWRNDRADGVQVNQDGSVSYADATLIFEDMANEPDIPFQFPDDGCYARAHFMAYRISERYGIDINDVDKVFIYGDLEAQTSFIYDQVTIGGTTDTSSTADGTVNWAWHVAPIINVRQGDINVPMVIDPSLSNRPLTIEQWKGIMNDPDAITEIAEHTTYGPNYSYDQAQREQIDGEAQDILEDYKQQCVDAGYCQP
ncbi:WXG100 family type VII secretion target [Herpetosiphon llansteffanensis]|uniref:WXG100 family type VII secretion target n=1 Tax=Herpetosiphon llansteffanensis TaxID=2094568 RepID=UPI000D7B9CCB|nr:WXG100 family type VII secretion target [Herpetosiphon llansteffanensis]